MVKGAGKLGFTIGVMTKADLNLGRAEQILENAMGRGTSTVMLPYKYVLISLGPANTPVEMESHEKEWMQAHSGGAWKPLSVDNGLGVDNLIQRFSSMYQVFITQNWLPRTIDMLDAHRATLLKRNLELGTPAFVTYAKPPSTGWLAEMMKASTVELVKNDEKMREMALELCDQALLRAVAKSARQQLTIHTTNSMWADVSASFSANPAESLAEFASARFGSFVDKPETLNAMSVTLLKKIGELYDNVVRGVTDLLDTELNIKTAFVLSRFPAVIRAFVTELEERIAKERAWLQAWWTRKLLQDQVLGNFVDRAIMGDQLKNAVVDTLRGAQGRVLGATPGKRPCSAVEKCRAEREGLLPELKDVDQAIVTLQAIKAGGAVGGGRRPSFFAALVTRA